MTAPQPLQGKWIYKNGILYMRYGKDMTGLDAVPYEAENLFDDVAAAVEFYKKYRHDPYLFEKHFPEEYEKFDGIGWESWCLNYSFADVVQKK